MLSLYIHVPFCQKKCSYCNFQVCPTSDMDNEKTQKLISQYVDSLKKEIISYAEKFWKQEILSLYFWWGTPLMIWVKNIVDIVNLIRDSFSFEHFWELSIEMNPYPQEEVYEAVSLLASTYKDLPRVRFSFGIQSFDNEVLQLTSRQVTFAGLADFLRWLKKYKKEHTVFNFDFIAFGKFHTTKQNNTYLWTPAALQFFTDFVHSWLADSFSLYTLELFSGSTWHALSTQSAPTQELFWNEDDIYEEFSLLKDILLDAWYHRYEISNFCLPGKSSIHNRTYWTMQDYLWLGTSWSSFIMWNSPVLLSWFPSWWHAYRWTNTINIFEYIKGNYVDHSTILAMTTSDLLIEEFFLRLRTDAWIDDLTKFISVLVPDYEDTLQTYVKEWFVDYDWKKLVLIDQGMDVYNTLITNLLQEI